MQWLRKQERVGCQLKVYKVLVFEGVSRRRGVESQMLQLFEVSPHTFRLTQVTEMQSRLHDLEGRLSLESLLLDGDFTLDFLSLRQGVNGSTVEMWHEVLLAAVVEAWENL